MFFSERRKLSSTTFIPSRPSLAVKKNESKERKYKINDDYTLIGYCFSTDNIALNISKFLTIEELFVPNIFIRRKHNVISQSAIVCRTTLYPIIKLIKLRNPRIIDSKALSHILKDNATDCVNGTLLPFTFPNIKNNGCISLKESREIKPFYKTTSKFDDIFYETGYYFYQLFKSESFKLSNWLYLRLY